MTTQQISILTDAVVVLSSTESQKTTTTTEKQETMLKNKNMIDLLPAEILEMILFWSWNPNQRSKLYSPYAIVCKHVCKRWWNLIHDWIDMCLQRDVKFQPDLAWQHAHTAITVATQALLDGHLELAKWISNCKASILTTSKGLNLKNMSWAADLGRRRNRINQIKDLRKLWMDCVVRAALQSDHYKNKPEPLLEWLWSSDKGKCSAGWDWMPPIHINDLELPLLWNHDTVAVWILKALCRQASRSKKIPKDDSLTFFGAILERKKDFPLEIINQVVETLSFGPGFSRRDRGRCLLAVCTSIDEEDEIDFCHRIIARLAGLFLTKGMIKSCDFVIRGLADPHYGLDLIFCYPKLLQLICMNGSVESAIWLANHVAMMAATRDSKHVVSYCLHSAVMKHNHILRNPGQHRTVRIKGSYEDTSKLLINYIIPALHGGKTDGLPHIMAVNPSLLQKLAEIWPSKKEELQKEKPEEPTGGIPTKWWQRFFVSGDDRTTSGAVGVNSQGISFANISNRGGQRRRHPMMNFGPRRQRIVIPRRPYTYDSSNKRLYTPTPYTKKQAEGTSRPLTYEDVPDDDEYDNYLVSKDPTDRRPIYQTRKQHEEEWKTPPKQKYTLVKGDQVHYISVYKQGQLEQLFQESEMYYYDHAYVSWCLLGLVRTFNLNQKQITQRRQTARKLIESGIPNNFYVIGILIERCDLKGLQWLAEIMDNTNKTQPDTEEEEKNENPTFAETMLWSYFSTMHVMRLPDPTQALFQNRDNEMLEWLMFKVKMFWKPRLNHMKSVDTDYRTPMMRRMHTQRRHFHKNGPAKGRRGYWTDGGFWRPHGRRSEAVMEHERNQEGKLKKILEDIERKREGYEACSIKKAVMRLGDDAYDDEW